MPISKSDKEKEIDKKAAAEALASMRPLDILNVIMYMKASRNYSSESWDNAPDVLKQFIRNINSNCPCSPYRCDGRC